MFLAVGGDHLELGQMQVIYRREIGAWSADASADALLVQAPAWALLNASPRLSGPLGRWRAL